MWDYYISFIDGFRQTILYFFVVCVYILLKLSELSYKPNILITLFLSIIKIIAVIFFFEYYLLYFIFKCLSIGGTGSYPTFNNSSKTKDEPTYYSYTDSDGHPCDQNGNWL